MTTPPTDERALLKRVHEELGRRLADAVVTRTATGSRLVAVEIEGGENTGMGVAHRPTGAFEPDVPDDARALSRWAFEPPRENPVAAALGIATLNARSVGAIRWQVGDPMGALDPDVDRIATVGLFRAAFRKFDAVDVRVIEREPIGTIDPPAGVSVSVFGPDEAATAIEGVDVLFVTGSSLIYGGTAAYLRAAVDVPTVVLIGATASFRPGPALEAGVDVVAGTRVTDPDSVWAGVGSGLCGTDLHGAGLEKVYVTGEAAPEGLQLGRDNPNGSDWTD